MTAHNQKTCESLFGFGFQPINAIPATLEQKLRLDENRLVQEFAERWFEPQATRYAFAQYTRTGEPLFDDYLSTVVVGTWKGVNLERAHLIIGYRLEPDSMKEYASTRVALGLCSSDFYQWLYLPEKGFTVRGTLSLDQTRQAIVLANQFENSYKEAAHEAARNFLSSSTYGSQPLLPRRMK